MRRPDCSPEKMSAVNLYFRFLVLSFVFGFVNQQTFSSGILPAEKVNSIISSSDFKTEVISISELTYTYSKKIIVLNAAGAEQCRFSEYENSFRKIKSVELKITSGNGIALKAFKKKDLSISSPETEALIDDLTEYSLSFSENQFPFTIDMNVEIAYSGILDFPNWTPIESYNQSVLSSRYILSVPKSILFKSKAYNMNPDSIFFFDNEKTKIIWSVSGLNPVVKETMSPGFMMMAPQLCIQPDSFLIKGYGGSSATWKEFGSWYKNLSDGRQMLDDAVKIKVHQLTDQVTDIKSKSKILYTYLQNNTRYISIQLGIGGWQPLDASFLCKNGYGDCKALVNFMHALLKEAGINSNPILINTKQKTDRNFPSNQFNHVILSIPLAKDTIWLECTSQDLPFNALGYFTENRYGLMVTNTGGFIIKTPSSSALQNHCCRKFEVSITASETPSFNASLSSVGSEAFARHIPLKYYSQEKRIELMQKFQNISGVKISEFNYFPFDYEKESGDINFSGSCPSLAQITAKRIFIKPGISEFKIAGLEIDSARTNPLILNYPFSITDSILIHYSPEYDIESLPDESNFINDGVSFYSGYFKISDGLLKVIFNIEIENTEISKVQYQDFIQFISLVNKDEARRIILRLRE